MKIVPLMTAAGIAVASLTALAPAPAAAQISVSVGAPAGPGWYRWHDRRAAQISVSVGAPAGPGWYRWHDRRGFRRGWDGPAYYRIRGPHYGWYRWNDAYYENCSWRWVGRFHRHREWRCW
jgi:hypothetical protein